MSEKRTVVILDTETSGLSKQMDWILQLSAVKISKDNFEALDKFNEYIRPEVPYEISPAAQETHGITKEFIEKHGKPMKEVGVRFLKFLEGSDIAGFNSNSFDIEFIYKDLAQAGLNLPFEGITFYDVRWMQTHLFPNKLSDLFERYCGHTMEEHGLTAHDASADVEATRIVMQKQFENHNLVWEDIDTWQENQLLVPDGTVRMTRLNGIEESMVFCMGKYRDKDIYQVMKEDPSYLVWCRDKLFSRYTLNVVRDYCRNREAQEKSQAN